MRVRELPLVGSEEILIYREESSGYENVYEGKFRDAGSWRESTVVVMGVSRFKKIIEIEVRL